MMDRKERSAANRQQRLREECKRTGLTADEIEAAWNQRNRRKKFRQRAGRMAGGRDNPKVGLPRGKKGALKLKHRHDADKWARAWDAQEQD